MYSDCESESESERYVTIHYVTICFPTHLTIASIQLFTIRFICLSDKTFNTVPVTNSNCEISHPLAKNMCFVGCVLSDK